MAVGKWIVGLTPAMPLAEAARLVLSARLEVVRDFLGLALGESDRDPEHVHQLRVGTRRAGAALRIFASCLSERKYRGVRKQLRSLRRAAGSARDWDVFLQSLRAETEHRPSRHQPGLDFLLGYALGMRHAAQQRLEAAASKAPQAIEKLIADTLAALEAPTDGPATLGAVARPLLGELVSELEAATSRDLHDYDHLHRVRIVGKRLRYAMEVFADGFAPAFREQLYPAVEEMQEILGRANDSHVAAQRLVSLREQIQINLPQRWKKFKPGIEGLLKLHTTQLPKERDHFIAWWKRWEQSGGITRFLSIPKA